MSRFTYITGICRKDYNNIDQQHIDALHKVIFVETNDFYKINNFYGKNAPFVENRLIINIQGRKNFSHILDREMVYKIKTLKKNINGTVAKMIFLIDVNNPI